MSNEYFPTAKQALEYTNGVINRKLSTLYSDMKEKIMAAANNGETYIYWEKALPQQAIFYLRQLGYQVTSCSQYNEFYYTITWKEK